MSLTYINRGHFYCPHVKPVLIDCSFKVSAGDTAGFGIVPSSLKGQGVSSVYMHSSLSFVGDTHTSTLVDGIADTSGLSVGMPVQGTGIPGGTVIASIIDGVSLTLSAATTTTTGGGTITYGAIGSPLPNAGIIKVQFSDNFQGYYGNFLSIQSPNGAATTSSKANVVNVITVLGTATLAQWQAVGLRPGITPAVGVTFIGNQAAVIGGSAQTAIVLAAGAGVDHVEVAGLPNLTLNPIPMGGSPHVGGYVLLECFKNTVLTNPTDNSILNLSFYLSQSSVQVSGE